MKIKPALPPFLSRYVAAVFLGVLFLANPVNAEVRTACGKYASVRVAPNSDSYRVHNNIWNGATKSQCIQVNAANGAFSVVSSKHNQSVHGAPASFAFINKGCHWGECAHAEGEFPKQVGSIVEARSSWSTNQMAEGVYNVAYDVWFHTNSAVIGQPDGAELMIWLAYKGSIQPVGALINAAVPIEGALWDVWAGWNGKNTVITYVRANSVESVDDLNIKSFIVDGAAKGYIRDDWYLVSIGAGFEIWQGGAGLTSNSFSFQIS